MTDSIVARHEHEIASTTCVKFCWLIQEIADYLGEVNNSISPNVAANSYLSPQ
ncbi:hypothetical protein C7212DRAFT_335321 [Tuber magnatum]|uniref:Uncharacterized protein n=1 Tax=Tuber magnatum TaxID=42249 RepID=A0A317SEF6_9PEZI|nr:hypothetical protein C7212DRAFT_335321 [Tuber magnatum]